MLRISQLVQSSLAVLAELGLLFEFLLHIFKVLYVSGDDSPKSLGVVEKSLVEPGSSERKQVSPTLGSPRKAHVVDIVVPVDTGSVRRIASSYSAFLPESSRK